jgi:hypothetical protein
MTGRVFGRTALAIVAWVFAALLLVQVFLAGLGVFDSPRDFDMHRQFGYTIGLLTIVLIVLALVARAPKGLVALTVLSFVQMVLQSVFVALRGDLPQLAALHPVNGVLLLVNTLVIGRWAWSIRHEAVATKSVAEAPASAEAPLIATVRD